MTREELYEKAIGLPLLSGVYIMKNAAGEVVYVGKSKKLRNRVSQYFAKIPHAIKTERMVQSVSDFDFILTASESEALILENIQIKKYLPKYNILLKDDKNYPYIKLTNEPYPRISVVRKRVSDGGEYYGPYSTIGSAGKAASTLEKLFAIPSCHKSFPKEIGKQRPCLNYHIGICVGVCTGKVSTEAYAQTISDLRTFMRGHQEKAVSSLEEKMYAASEAMDFERAAFYRDSIKRIKALRQRQTVQGNVDRNIDVIAVYDGEQGSAMTVATIRDGCFSDKFSFRFGAATVIDGGTLCSAIYEIYSQRDDIPGRILTGFELDAEETASCEEFLGNKAGKRVHVTPAKIGDNKKLCDLVLANAKECVTQYNEQRNREGKTLVSLASLLALEVFPNRIEAYDVSNWGDDFISIGMIVLEHGAFSKRAYRSFNAKYNETQNDCACMAEAVARRIRRGQDGDESFLPLPDLILADGGVGQVNAVRAELEKLNAQIPVFGMVKDSHHKTRTLTDGDSEISIATNGEIFGFIYRIQDEVHRFSLSRMDARRKKRVTKSSLEGLQGVGEARAKALLVHFGGINELKSASVDDICKVKNFSRKLAENIYKQLHKENED